MPRRFACSGPTRLANSASPTRRISRSGSKMTRRPVPFRRGTRRSRRAAGRGQSKDLSSSPLSSQSSTLRSRGLAVQPVTIAHELGSGVRSTTSVSTLPPSVRPISMRRSPSPLVPADSARFVTIAQQLPGFGDRDSARAQLHQRDVGGIEMGDPDRHDQGVQGAGSADFSPRGSKSRRYLAGSGSLSWCSAMAASVVPRRASPAMPCSPLTERKSVPWGIRKSFGAVNPRERNWRNVACRD